MTKSNATKKTATTKSTVAKKSTTKKSVKKTTKSTVAKKSVKKTATKKPVFITQSIKTNYQYKGDALITPFKPTLINHGIDLKKPPVYLYRPTIAIKTNYQYKGDAIITPFKPALKFDATTTKTVVNPLLAIIKAKNDTVTKPLTALESLMGKRPSLSPLQKLMSKQTPVNQTPTEPVVGHVKMKNIPIHQNLTGKTVLTHRVLKPSIKSKVCIDINNAIDTYDFKSKKQLVDFLIANTTHKPVTIKTYVTDGFNPKYCRLQHLLTIGNDGFIEWVKPTPTNPFTITK